ncbi:hypothetical protein RMSM_02992 [Rhodopirellula maiorica SM1]|uniref:Uncharacterized protein n=1 Tax=Rhodopirellula maiorica SM1 TaxID=1265738 RepID=M5RL72_9BACT|nr:hypothetical protein [Rhodopirellula maiorica]EMI20078.1 hypothetical protein RMSM_02992 [Rhodopirellula maiorica SM1]
MSRLPQTPEELVLQFELAEMLELLEDLGFESTPQAAAVFRQTLKTLGCLEKTLAHFATPTSQRHAA